MMQSWWWPPELWYSSHCVLPPGNTLVWLLLVKVFWAASLYWFRFSFFAVMFNTRGFMLLTVILCSFTVVNRLHLNLICDFLDAGDASTHVITRHPKHVMTHRALPTINCHQEKCRIYTINKQMYWDTATLGSYIRFSRVVTQLLLVSGG